MTSPTMPHSLVLGLADPWARSFGGPLRTRAFVDGLVAAGHRVTAVFPADPSTAGVVERDGCLRVGVPAVPMGERRMPAFVGALKRAVVPLPMIRGGYVPAISRAIAEHGPYDWIVAQELRTAIYAGETQPARLWLDQTDVLSAFARREAERRRGPLAMTALRQADHFAREEIATARDAGMITAAGFADAAELGAAVGRPVHWMPTPVDVAQAAPRPGGTPTAGFFANFEYWPNRDAYDLLVDAWLPALRSAGWEVLVAGFGSDALPAHEGVRRLGPLGRADEFYEQIDVSLAPMRRGGGVKVKVIEALMAGRPVFATAAAIDGVSADVRALVTELADHPATVPAPAEVASRTPKDDTALLRRLFSAEAFAARLRELLADA